MQEFRRTAPGCQGRRCQPGRQPHEKSMLDQCRLLVEAARGSKDSSAKLKALLVASGKPPGLCPDRQPGHLDATTACSISTTATNRAGSLGMKDLDRHS
jgi:hypothetical protein